MSKRIVSKLIFNAGAMGVGKTSSLIGTHYAYKDAGFKILLGKPMIDSKGDTKVEARNKQCLETDFLIGENDNIADIIWERFEDADVIIIDEVQFLKRHHIDELADLVYKENKLVICYGLLTDFQEKMFDASMHLIEVGAELKRLTIPCECGRDRTHNLRLVNGVPTFTGNQIEIDGANNVIEYVSMCGACFNKRRVLRRVDPEQYVFDGF